MIMDYHPKLELSGQTIPHGAKTGSHDMVQDPLNQHDHSAQMSGWVESTNGARGHGRLKRDLNNSQNSHVYSNIVLTVSSQTVWNIVYWNYWIIFAMSVVILSVGLWHLWWLQVSPQDILSEVCQMHRPVAQRKHDVTRWVHSCWDDHVD